MASNGVPSGVGLVESAQRLVDSRDRSWAQVELLQAAERAVLHHTGWPIGLVLTKPELAPTVSADGIEARMGHYTPNDDYWAFRRDASFYVAREFEEDRETTRGQAGGENKLGQLLWFDTRVWRIAEIILHSSALYRELGIPTDEPYVLMINHLGLNGRELSAWSGSRHVRGGRFCRVPDVSWSREVTQDEVYGDTKALVRSVARELFVLFDFADFEDHVIDGVVAQFLSSRV